MIARIIQWSMHNPLLISLATLLIIFAGILAVKKTPLDAIPDLSDPQVIIYTEYPGQAPQVVEDQITYPLASAMLNVPRSSVVRGFSMFGVSFIYIIFEEGTDIYWARSRVLEYLNFSSSRLPQGITPTLGPDATGVGWIYQYAVTSSKHTLEELRTLQDWHIRYALSEAKGISEVASVGGFVKQYQVVADPRRLQNYGISLQDISQAIQKSNRDVGGRTLELRETEYIVHGKGYLKGLQDLQKIVLRNHLGTPVFLKDVAQIELGPDERRGLSELNGEGEVVSGIVIQRFGQNALQVITDVKEKLKSFSQSLPEGIKIFSVYDRSELIERAITTLKNTLLEECIIVALVCIIFLFHVRSALVAILMLPIGILIALIIMHALGVSSNIMSLGGIAIAIGAMVDAAIVMIENAHKHLERLKVGESRFNALMKASIEVGPALFFSLLIITVSFLPIFTLEAQEGRLFKPLAFTKTFAMAASALLSITLVPMLMIFFVRGKILPEEKNPINRILIKTYRPLIVWVLKWKKLTLILAGLVFVVSLYPLKYLGSEFMPTLNEGALLYMPTTLPGLSITKAAELMQVQNKIIKNFPEVASVYGKAGRANTATDPAPLEMFETVINLKAENEWRPGLTLDALIAEMNQALQLPGVSNAWTMPIKARIDMLSTGIRTPVGIKVFGKDLKEIETLAKKIEAVMRTVPGTTSAYSERILGGYYLEIEPKRNDLARYGLSIEELQETIEMALGGKMITTVVEGRERFSVNLRYAQAFRESPQAIAHKVLLKGNGSAMVPLGEVANIKLKQGPSTIRTENGQLVAYIFVDFQGQDIGNYVAEAKGIIANNVKIPTGYTLKWSGQYEYMERAKEKLKIVVPFTLMLIFLLLYFNFRRLTETLIIMLSLPFSIIGGIWLMYFLNFNFSMAVAVGFIALAGVAAETGVIMLIYLDHAFEKMQKQHGEMWTLNHLYSAVMEGAVERVRPKVMTVVAIMGGLLPILWNHGTGSEVMQRIAVPMIGGMVSSTLLTLLVIPALYALLKMRENKNIE
jgi:Cu(I)/Ag(I) efflux system membrane protein CusA/SilA